MNKTKLNFNKVVLKTMYYKVALIFTLYVYFWHEGGQQGSYTSFRKWIHTLIIDYLPFYSRKTYHLFRVKKAESKTDHKF